MRNFLRVDYMSQGQPAYPGWCLLSTSKSTSRLHDNRASPVQPIVKLIPASRASPVNRAHAISPLDKLGRKVMEGELLILRDFFLDFREH